MFGDLTTLSLAFANTTDTVGENNGTAFVPVITWLGHAESRSYDVDLSQILTKNLIAGVNFNVITDQGYLANPYRSVRFLDAEQPQGLFARQPGLSRHPHQHGGSGGGASTTCPIARPSPARIGISATPGASWAIPTSSTTPTRSAISGSWKAGSATTSRTTRTSTATCFTYADEYRFEGRDQDLAAQDNYTIGAKVDLRVPAERLEDVQARDASRFDVSRITFHYLDFRNIKYYGRAAVSAGRRAAVPVQRHGLPALYVDVLLTRCDDAAPPHQQHGGERRDDGDGIGDPIPEIAVPMHDRRVPARTR